MAKKGITPKEPEARELADGRITFRPPPTTAGIELAKAVRQIPSYQRAIALDAYYELRAKYLKRIENVEDPLLGIDCGPKRVFNEVTCTPCIRILVQEKLPLRKLSKKQRIPKHYNGVPTDVIAIHPIRTAAPLQGSDDIRPVSPPMSVGRMGVMVLGVTPEFETEAPIMFLTAAHVVQGNQPASTLNSAIPVYNLAQVQVGRSIPNSPDENNWRRDELMDAALVAPTAADSLPGIRGHVNVPMNFLSRNQVQEDLVVRLLLPNETREGTIETIHQTYAATRAGVSETISSHILVRRLSTVFAAQGDSGALVVDQNNAAIGIVRAVFDVKPQLSGTPVSLGSNPEYTVLTPMWRIVNSFRVFPTNRLDDGP